VPVCERRERNREREKRGGAERERESVCVCVDVSTPAAQNRQDEFVCGCMYSCAAINSRRVYRQERCVSFSSGHALALQNECVSDV